MKVNIVGSGSIGSSFMSASLIIDDHILVDAPNGIIKYLKHLDYNILKIDTIIITHLHGDHFLDIPFFMLEKYFQKATNMTKIICPKGTMDKTKALFDLTFPEEWNKVSKLSCVEFIEFEEMNEEKITDELYVTAKLVEHGDLKPAYGYIVNMQGKSVGFSGDSRLCNSIFDIVERSEISILDMSVTDKKTDAHMGLYDIKEICEKYKDKKIILYCCRISMEKRPLLAIRILKKVCENDKNVVMFVVGDGDKLRSMKKMAEKLELNENVVFFGSKKNVKPFYKACNVELICSLSEGLTLTTYEAMSMKRPVVSANVGGQKELIDSSCGVIVDNIQSQKELFKEDYSEEEIERYSNAILHVLNSKEYEKMKERCREKILDGFTIKNMIKTMTTEIDSLINDGSKVGMDSAKYRELYSQYLVLYNQLDQRNYFSTKGGIGVEGEFYEEKTQRLKDELWQNPVWRGFIRILQKTGIMSKIKKSGMDRKVKEAVVRKIK